MDATWPTWVKASYAVTCFVLFAIVMWAISRFVIAPMETTFKDWFASLPLWAQIACCIWPFILGPPYFWIAYRRGWLS